MRCARVCLWLVTTTCLLHLPSMSQAVSAPLRVYIGTYTGPKSQGIYCAEFDPATGALTTPKLAAPSRNPTFLALPPKTPVLYAAEEISNFDGRREGSISAWSIDEKSGQLILLNRQGSGGAGPCHLSVNKTGTCVLVANYGSGSIAVLPIETGGRLARATATVQHLGSSINRQRQEGPHAHFIIMDPGNKFALVCDLGLDKILSYRLESDSGAIALVPNDPPGIAVQRGSGPRHLAFAPNGRVAYLISELASTLTVLNYDQTRGTLTQRQTISTLPAEFKDPNIAAEVHVHPNGRFVYGSNRGDDSIAVFAVNAKTGQLSFVQRQSTLGRTPRHFTFDPTGRWLLVENQDSDNIVVFRVDPKTGRLAPAGNSVEVGAPVCLLFASRR